MRIDLSLVKPKPKQPLHKQLASLIRGAINEGVYLPGEQIETEREFVAEGEFSRPVVTQALKELVSDGLIYRRAGAGTFVAETSNQMHRVATLGWLTDRYSSGYFNSIKIGMESECKHSGIRLVSLEVDRTEADEQEALSHLLKHDIQAIIASPSPVFKKHSALISMLDRNNVPIVLAGAFLPQLECDTVIPHNEAGAYQLTQHLIRCGHRRIGLLATRGHYPTVTIHLSLVKGRNRALRDAGLSQSILPPILLPPAFDEQHDTQVHRAIIDQLVATNRPTAMLCMSDKSAVFLIELARNTGISVPSDLSVVGFGDLPIAQQHSPPLTTVRWPLQRIGEEAVRLAITKGQMKSRQTTRIMLDTELIIRESVVGPS